MPPPGRAEQTESDTPPRLIGFRRLTLRSAPGTPQRGDPYHPGVNSSFGVRVESSFSRRPIGTSYPRQIRCGTRVHRRAADVLRTVLASSQGVPVPG